MNYDLKVTFIQSDLHWESPEANLAMFEEKIWQIQGSTDLIILPEMFNTGFSMDAARLAEPMNSRTFRWMKQMASQTQAVIVGSYIIKENLKFFNRLFWVEPDGSFEYYDKRHLFRMAEEDKTFTAGSKRLIKSYKGWKICPMVCYDLRFPAWSRNVYKDAELTYDLLIYVANWPTSRISAWDILLRARAIENISYVAAVNRIGKDGKEVDYCGHSTILNAKGEEVVKPDHSEKIVTVSLGYQELQDFRRKFPAFLDADDFEIKL